MTNWQEELARYIVNLEDHIDLLKYRLGGRFFGRDPLMIQPYRGFGSDRRLFIKGRVLEDKGIEPAADADTIWNNLLNMYRRFESDEVPFARVLVKYQDQEQEVEADIEGYFEAWIEPDQPVQSGQIWQQVQLELVVPNPPDSKPVLAEGQVLVPPSGAQYGVISDIDDTVLQTDATHLLNMARTVFLGNARTRLPFKGVAAFYRALYHAAHGGIQKEAEEKLPFNPLYYVSSSPWNLYDLLSDFFHLQDIPIGPVLFLRDWGISEQEFIPSGHRSHKMKAIRTILDTCSSLPFILVGDSGQEDPEIYSEVVSLYKDRILAIYIRNVSRDLKRPEAIHKLAEQVAKAGSTLILADDTLPMAEHAASQGWIRTEDLPEIAAEKRADEQPTEIEKILGKQAAPKEEPPTVVVKTETPEQTEEAVEEGVIEEALHVEEKTKEPPAVIIEEEDKNAASDEADDEKHGG